MNKRMSPKRLFSLNEHLETLENDTLEKLDEIVNFELFREMITEALDYGYKVQGGRPPFDPVVMFKILILQSMHNLSDKKTEQMVRGYLPWMLFLGFEFGDVMPDENTIRHFRNRLTEMEVLPVLMQAFNKELSDNDYDARGGMIMDATLVPSPKQRLTKEEKEAIEEGQSAQEIWENPNKAAQKDVDARWVLRKKGKGGKGKMQIVEATHGYGFHACADRKHKLIRNTAVTPANVHDSRCFKELVDFTNTAQVVWADSAYWGEEREAWLEENGIRSNIMRRGTRGNPISAASARANSKKARVRARVEHVFGDMKNRFGLYIRTIGLERAETKLLLAAMVYNMNRFVFLKRRRCTVG